MTTSPLIMTTFNGKDYLEEQLCSLEDQTVSPDEPIIGDDCSDDGTMSILEAFVARAPFSVRLHRNPVRLGYARNFAACARHASGEILFFVDQDDIWHPEKIDRVVAGMDAVAADVSLHDLTVFFDSGRPSIASYHRHLQRLRVSGSGML